MNNKIIRLPAIEVQKRFFELLDEIFLGELQKVEIEFNGEVVAEMTSIKP